MMFVHGAVYVTSPFVTLHKWRNFLKIYYCECIATGATPHSCVLIP